MLLHAIIVLKKLVFLGSALNLYVNIFIEAKYLHCHLTVMYYIITLHGKIFAPDVDASFVYSFTIR